jgi:hypothetical protein
VFGEGMKLKGYNLPQGDKMTKKKWLIVILIAFLGALSITFLGFPVGNRAYSVVDTSLSPIPSNAGYIVSFVINFLVVSGIEFLATKWRLSRLQVAAILLISAITLIVLMLVGGLL